MPVVSFNPSVGILFVHTWTATTWWATPLAFQSLGRDSVCSYSYIFSTPFSFVMFQSLGRDSVCSYSSTRRSPTSSAPFQSLGRDSVCSYQASRLCHLDFSGVSIPRSGFCLFIPGAYAQPADDGPVSIPRSGFCLFILVTVIMTRKVVCCFV